MKPSALIKFCLFIVFQLFALTAFASDDRYEVSKKWFPQNFDKDYGEIASALKKSAVTTRTIPCNDDERPALKCYRAKRGANSPEAFIAPPYLPLVPRKLSNGTFARLGMFFQKPPEALDATFVPLSQIYDGAASWNWWVQSAKKGTFFRDTRTDDEDLKAGDEYGFTFVQSFVAGRKDIQEIIGVCRVQRVKSKVIFFGYCTPIALVSNGKKWAFADWYINAVGGDSSRPDLIFDLSYSADGIDDKIQVEIQRLLEAKPWNLFVRIRRNLVSAYSDKRESKIISTLREQPSINVIFESGTGLQKSISIEASATVLVNDLATLKPTDWHEPNSVQLAAYVSELSRTIKRAIDNVCGSARWIDRLKVQCGV